MTTASQSFWRNAAKPWTGGGPWPRARVIQWVRSWSRGSRAMVLNIVGEVTGGGQVRAGVQDAVELVALAVGQGVGVAHDPGGDAARAGDWPRWFGGGGAGAEGRDVLGDDDAAAAVPRSRIARKRAAALVTPPRKRWCR